MHVKDLRVLDRELTDMVLIDNAAYSYIYQLDNGIPILPYYHGNTDYELKALQSYIESMLLLKDMRSANRRTFKLYQYKNYYYDLEKLVEELYLIEHGCWNQGKEIWKYKQIIICDINKYLISNNKVDIKLHKKG